MQPEANTATSPHVVPLRKDWPKAAPPLVPELSAEDYSLRGKLRRVVDCLALRLAPQGQAAEGGSHRVDALDAAEVEELRQTGVESPEPGRTFWRLAVRHLEPTGLLQEDDADSLRAWQAVLRAMAELAGRHRPGRRLGRALALARVGESRMRCLLRASGSDLANELATAARTLCVEDQRVDCFELACLVLSEGGPVNGRRRVRRTIESSFRSTPAVRRRARTRRRVIQPDSPLD